ncbi:MAG: tRNA preQ1(34) S-adenosylmethionine ribosyltransferase-isomerase QueA [bacterium]|nr:MAG: tRNA preQ1(34) S-adenosylmethionine ribosyltransferase-isomerase QueA [bacterium]
MSLEMFDYSLPESLIAQRPSRARTGSRLLHLDRQSGSIGHHGFYSLPGFLAEGDLLVLNDTRVFPARLTARRETGGAVEIFLLKLPAEGEEVPCLVRPARRVREEDSVVLDNGRTLIIRRRSEGFTVTGKDTGLDEAVEKLGQVPLPPYIHRRKGFSDEEDRERYQTVYASRPGAVAAPTAGLHFDEDLLALIRERGVSICNITLHVGHGTFKPVRTPDITAHRMEEETYIVPPETADMIESVKGGGGRVIAAGTTVVRTLESAFDGNRVRAGEGSSRLFIYPGYRFSVVDALLTNFHLPRSTLLMLVCAFAGTDLVMTAYREAVKKEYRFYSYGDAMFIE